MRGALSSGVSERHAQRRVRKKNEATFGADAPPILGGPRGGC